MENLELVNIKEQFLKNGYCQFPVKLLDVEFYELLHKNYLCNETKNLKHLIREVRFDSEEFKTKYKDNDFNKLDTEKEKLYNQYKDVERSISQMWFMNNDNKELPFKDKIESGLDKIVKFLYDLDETTKITHPELQLTYYNKHCRFESHVDGMTADGIICSILIYLNENYKKEHGGLLVFNDELIVPEFGICALMDMTKHQIKHGVTEVTDGNGRFAILSFPKLEH